MQIRQMPAVCRNCQLHGDNPAPGTAESLRDAGDSEWPVVGLSVFALRLLQRVRYRYEHGAP